MRVEALKAQELLDSAEAMLLGKLDRESLSEVCRIIIYAQAILKGR